MLILRGIQNKPQEELMTKLNLEILYLTQESFRIKPHEEIGLSLIIT